MIHVTLVSGLRAYVAKGLFITKGKFVRRLRSLSGDERQTIASLGDTANASGAVVSKSLRNYLC